MRRRTAGLGVVVVLGLAACRPGGEPPTPVQTIEDDDLHPSVTNPQIVEHTLSPDLHIRLVGEVGAAPDQSKRDAFRIPLPLPVGTPHDIAFDCTDTDPSGEIPDPDTGLQLYVDDGPDDGTAPDAIGLWGCRTGQRIDDVTSEFLWVWPYNGSFADSTTYDVTFRLLPGS